VDGPTTHFSAIKETEMQELTVEQTEQVTGGLAPIFAYLAFVGAAYLARAFGLSD
jgi:hypothetical protein